MDIMDMKSKDLIKPAVLGNYSRMLVIFLF